MQEIVNFAKDKAAGEEDGKLGRGVGLAIGLFLCTVTTSICQHQV
jgi:hypothetical protein